MPVTLRSNSRSGKGKAATEDEQLIEQSLKQFKISYEAESATRTAMLDDLQFSIGDGQWDGAIKAERDIEGRPCLTINRIPTFLRQYTGEERQNRPAMMVSPVGSGADKETAEIQQGVLRHIEQVSVADVIYDTSYDMMLRIGVDYWRVNNEYVSDTSFQQEPRIEGIENPFAVYLSPIRRYDGTDPLWGHVVQDMTKDEYKEKYPKSRMARINFAGEIGNAEPMWLTKDGIRIAEYWWLELQRKQLVLLDDGTTAFKNELSRKQRNMIAAERDTITRKVCCVKHNAVEILQRYEWMGKYIPIVEVSGVRLNVNGKIYRAGMVRDAKDPQRVYNFEVTGMAEKIALSDKDPLFVAEGSIDNHEEEYRQLSQKNYPYLYYKAYEDDKPLPAPVRSSRETMTDALQKMIQQSDYDLKSVIGIYGPSLGEQGPAQESGFAVLKRQQQTETGSINWSDNLNRAIRYQAKILLDLWPKTIDEARVQRIINPDDTVKHAVVMNSQNGEDQGEQAQALLDQQKGLKKVYDVGVGEYDVTLSSGPSYATARKEGFAAMTAILTSKPEMLSVLGDVWAGFADWPGAQVVVDRLRMLAYQQNPSLAMADADDKDATIAKLQGSLQQLAAQHDQLVAELSRASDTIRTDRLSIESKERIALMQDQTQIMVAELKSISGANTAQLQATLAAIGQRLQMLHEQQPIEVEAGQAPQTPELPNKVEPKVQPMTPAAPVVPVRPIGGGQQ